LQLLPEADVAVDRKLLAIVPQLMPQLHAKLRAELPELVKVAVQALATGVFDQVVADASCCMCSGIGLELEPA
jgi:hypothetical protein